MRQIASFVSKSFENLSAIEHWLPFIRSLRELDSILLQIKQPELVIHQYVE